MPFSDRCIRHLSSQYAGYICLTMVDWPMATGLRPLTVMIQSPLILRFYWHKILWFDTADISNSDWYLVIFLLINWYILSRRPRVCLGLSCIAVTNDIMTLEIELWCIFVSRLSLKSVHCVSHCPILSPDKTEWRLISATLCGWRRCFVADELWLMKRIQEEAWLCSRCFEHLYSSEMEVQE